MPDDPIQILEVRANGAQRPVTVTAAVTADAGQAIFIALSEQLDRRRRDLITSPDGVLALRQQAELVERFAPVADSHRWPAPVRMRLSSSPRKSSALAYWT
jgi:hypothetical protein